jgi:hypothetical protein
MESPPLLQSIKGSTPMVYVGVSVLFGIRCGQRYLFRVPAESNGEYSMAERIKKFVSVIGGKLDVTCDECGSKMRPGGHYQLEVGDKSYQFDTEKCMEAYEAKL